MIESKSNIWSTNEVAPKQQKNKKFFKKCIRKIKQIEKEKTLSQANNTITNEHDKQKAIFINKKRGRKSKSINEVSRGGIHDRFSDDNLKRKVKTHFHNYIIALLNSKLVIKNPNDKVIKFGKMKSTITQNITVEYNQNLFKKTIKEIITEVSNKYQNQFINSDCIKYVMNNPKENMLVIQYLNMTYKDMYLNYYLKSTKKDFPKGDVNESYEAHKEKLKKFGEKYLQNYIKNAEGLIDFYNKCKKRKSRKKIENQSINDLSNIEIDKMQNKEVNTPYFNEEIINQNLSNEDNNENIFDKNMKSEYTQTDIKPTEDETESENE